MFLPKKILTWGILGLTCTVSSNPIQLPAPTATVIATKIKNKPPLQSNPITMSLEYKSGTIEKSFYFAAKQAGFTKNLREEMATIFKSNAIFQHKLTRNDHFSILYQEYFIRGKKDHPGNIVVASFTHKNKTYQAIRYTDSKNQTNYYTPDGYDTQPLFLSTPVNYKRISSYFSYERMDPYLHIIHPHLGIDYAAPSGTPVKSIGNGRVIFAGYDHGYGNAVIIYYNPEYKTLYGHLEKFAEGVRLGQNVKRGQTIGYLGNTGWSTGPHLHFEMYVYGVPRDPLKLKPPKGESIPYNYRKNYLTYAHKMLERFNFYQETELAENDTAKNKG